MVFKKILALISIMRPLDWGKQFANMALGYFTALIILGQTATIDFSIIATAILIIGPLFCGGLYAINDWADWKKDQKHAAKKERAIPAGKISPNTALAFGITLVVASFIAAFHFQNALLLVCMAMILLNQWFYSMEPFYVKKRLFFDFFSGAIINPIFRFLSGWAIVTQSLSMIPISIIVFAISIQYVFYSISRLSTKKLEKELGFTSTVVVLKEQTIIATAITAFFIAIISYVYACAAIIGIKFIIPLLLSGILLPMYVKAMEHPQQLQFNKMKTIVYLHFYGFAILFAAIYFLKI